VVIATIDVGENPVDLCYAAAVDKVYCGNWSSNSVSVISCSSDSVVATVTAAGGPVALCYNDLNKKGSSRIRVGSLVG